MSDIRFEGTADLRSLSAPGVGDLRDLVILAGASCFAGADGTPNCLDISFEDAVAIEVLVPRLAQGGRSLTRGARLPLTLGRS